MFELFLGTRYLKAKRKQGFISVITMISTLGVMMGVMALVVVLSVMNGFRADLMKKILGVNSHIMVLNFKGPFLGYDQVNDIISEVGGVKAATPFIYSQVMVNNSGKVSGAVLRGIDPDRAGHVLNLEHMIKNTRTLDSLANKQGELPSIILGRELSRQIGAYPGDVVTLVSPEGKLTPLGRVPNTRKYLITDVFESGMYEYDVSMVYVSIKDAQEFLGLGNRVTGIEVRVDNADQSNIIAGNIKDRLGYPFWTMDWKEKNRSLFAALKLEKITMFVILTMIVLVGALNIISSLVMIVMEKTRDVAILRAMGASSGSIMSIFMFQGLLVGLVGTIAGLSTGYALCEILAKYQFIDLDPTVYYISKLPVLVEIKDIMVVAVSAVIISFLATIYPSIYAARLNPVEALRYE